MATIQIRDVADEAYEIIRRRARVAGQSIQTYMKDQIERLAREPTDAELLAEIERHIELDGTEVDRAALIRDLDTDRR